MLPIDATQYSYITCTEVNLPGQGRSLDSKLIHNNDVEFRLQTLQIAYPNYKFTVTKCRP